jgi:hypothetical protein
VKINIFCTALLLIVTIASRAQPGGGTTDVSPSFFVPTESQAFYNMAGKTIPIKIMQYGERTDLICINLHSNEDASVKAAMAVLEKYGGTLIRIENNRQRVIRFKLKGVSYAFDPNRMFSAAGIEQTLRENSRVNKAAADEIEKFAINILAMLPDTVACVVALHNNTEEAYSIRTYLEGGQRQSDAKAVYANETQDVDDIVLTTDSLLFQQMADHGYNAIWQDNENAKKDGSLSIYFGEAGRRYINIETQHGKVEQYAEMLEKLIAILDEENKKPPLQLQ